MKILISIGTMQEGGAERVVSILIQELVKLGPDVELLLYYDREIFYKVDPSVKIIVDNVKNGNILKHLVWRRNYIGKNIPDVMISFLAPFNILNIVATLGMKVKVIVADRNDPAFVPVNFFCKA